MTLQSEVAHSTKESSTYALDGPTSFHPTGIY